MNALELEDEEVERFLNEADGSSYDNKKHRKPSSIAGLYIDSSNTAAGGFYSWHSNAYKVGAALLAVVLVLSLTVLLGPAAEDTTIPDTNHPLPSPQAPIPAPSPPVPPPPPQPSPAATNPGGTAPSGASNNNNDSPLFENGGVSSESDASSSTVTLVYSKVSSFDLDLDATALSDESHTAMVEKWGKWKFWDGDEDMRPSGDYCAHFPHRDIPGDDFPDNAWQTDAVFVNHLIDAAEQLIARAKESIFTEYGKGKPLPPEQLLARQTGFKWDAVDLSTNPPQLPEAFDPTKGGTRDSGGLTTKRSQKGLARRLLHAIMTNDEFVVVVLGDAAAAGHGGHFHQSYAHQLHRTLYPVLARLGVKLVTRNLSSGIGGLGTIQAALGFRDLVGDDIDVLVWDGMAAEDDPDRARETLDFIIRQALLSGKSKIPQIWVGANSAMELLRDWHQTADVDLGEFGTGLKAVKLTESADQARTLPQAVQYLQCASDAQDLCRNHDRFCAKCWIDRPDVDPTQLFDKTVSAETPPGQVTWHLGWQEHLLRSRVLLMEFLNGLQTAIQTFSEGTMGGPPLDDSAWHVTDYYNNVRRKVRDIDPNFGVCGKLQERNLPARICRTVMKGRTLHTPRYQPEKSSLLTLIRAAPDGYKPTNPLTVGYDGPDVHNPCYDIPEDGIDVVHIVSNRRRNVAADDNREKMVVPDSPPGSETSTRSLDSDGTIVPGKGWEVVWEKPGTCDGAYRSICGRERTEPCPLLGHHDSQGTLVGNEYSGWLVLDLPDVNEGIIVLRMMTGLAASDNKRTEGWASVNNERRLDDPASSQRLRNGSDPPPEPGTTDTIVRDLSDDLPDDMVFEFAINGQVTTWDKAALLEKKSQPQRMIHLWTLLDDHEWSSKGSVVLAIRLRGCGNRCTVGIPHVYWA